MKKIFYYLSILICCVALCFSCYKLFTYFAENSRGNSYYDNLLIEVADGGEDDSIPITIDFEKLRAENSDIIAWAYCEGTPINYPVMRSKDNLDYLRRLPDGKYNRCGSLFLDCGCSDDFSDFISIIYGHNMKNDKMFGTITRYKNQDYYSKHKRIYLLTPQGNYAAELVSGFETDVNSTIYSYLTENDSKADFVEMITQKSDFTPDVTVSENDRFVVFSTCSYSSKGARYVAVGKLTQLPE